LIRSLYYFSLTGDITPRHHDDSFVEILSEELHCGQDLGEEYEI
jgi:hypothetical protein